MTSILTAPLFARKSHTTAAAHQRKRLRNSGVEIFIGRRMAMSIVIDAVEVTAIVLRSAASGVKRHRNIPIKENTSD